MENIYFIKKYYTNGFFKRIVEDNILSLLVCTMFLLLPLFFFSVSIPTIFFSVSFLFLFQHLDQDFYFNLFPYF